MILSGEEIGELHPVLRVLFLPKSLLSDVRAETRGYFARQK